MARDHRIVAPGGGPVDYSCENRRYKTNLKKGFSHGSLAATLGSVFTDALINTGDYSLWLEHVVETDTEEEIYWLMWYDRDGKPTIPLSGVFGRDDLEQMVGRLAKFVP